jgi:putative oxidoreductase
MVEEKAFFALRIVTGILFFMHGLAKLQKGMAVVVAAFDGYGVPGWLAYPVMGIELLGGAALVLGLGARYAAWALAAIMAGAIVTVKWEHGLLSSGGKSGYELDLIYLAVLVCVALKRTEKRPG